MDPLIGRFLKHAAMGLFTSYALFGHTVLAEPLMVSAGDGHSCVLLSTGTIQCWGYNGSGQLGDGTQTTRATPVQVKGISDAIAVSAGKGHTCAALRNGTVQCWGSNASGGLGIGSNSYSSSVPETVSGITTAVAVSAGYASGCATLNNGQVQCWGRSNLLGNGSRTDSSVPVLVSDINNATAVTMSLGHACAQLSTAAVQCWGSNQAGQLGSEGPSSRTPITANGINAPKSVAAGAAHTCALFASGEVQCWGNNQAGQLGNGTTANSKIPVPVTGIDSAISVSVGVAHSCAVLFGGAVRCWGDNHVGELGNGTITASTVPVPVTRISTAVSVTAGDQHTCAMLLSGALQCWGRDGSLGNGSSAGSRTPVIVVGFEMGATSVESDANKIFAWAERSFPMYFKSFARSSSFSVPGFRVRSYAFTHSHLGVSDTDSPRLYYSGPVSANAVVDLGPLSDWLIQVGP